jgi:hypothetical protein
MNMNATLEKLLLALAFSGLSLAAFASDADSCTTEPKTKWLKDKEVQAKLEKQGYTVKRIKTEGSCYEAYVQGKDGKKAELLVNPVDGAPVKEEGKS